MNIKHEQKKQLSKAHMNSIRKHLQIVGSILFDNNGSLKERLNTISIAKLINSIDFLEKGKVYASDSYRKEIDYLIKEARCKL